MKPTLVINAGGRSRRMGQTKALLPVPPDAKPLLLHIADRLGPLAEPPIWVIANDGEIRGVVKSRPEMIYLRDAYPGAGPLGGLITALRYCVNRAESQVEDWLMVVACDMPLVNPAVFGLLCQIADAALSPLDAVVPHVDGHWQPLHALYHPRALPKLQQCFAEGGRSLQQLLPELNVQKVGEAEICTIDPQLASFLNVNRPQEWSKVLHQLAMQD